MRLYFFPCSSFKTWGVTTIEAEEAVVFSLFEDNAYIITDGHLHLSQLPHINLGFLPRLGFRYAPKDPCLEQRFHSLSIIDFSKFDIRIHSHYRVMTSLSHSQSTNITFTNIYKIYQPFVKYTSEFKSPKCEPSQLTKYLLILG